MRITFALNSDFQQFLDGSLKADYRSSRDLLNTCLSRGHEVRIVHPDHAVPGQGFSKVYYLDGQTIVETDQPFDTDVLFARHNGENLDFQATDNFIDTLKSLEGVIPLLINNGHATSFERKDRQKTLPLPFIPSFQVDTLDGLVDLVKQHPEGIIIKPIYGFLSKGVEYVQSEADVDGLVHQGRLAEGNLNKFVFEQFIPADTEIRYVFLFGKIIASKINERIGLPGKEKYRHRFPNKDYDPRHVKIVKMAIDATGMKYGSVDFRKNHVLEVNGAGTGTFSEQTYAEGKMLYDATDRVMDAVERAVKQTC